MHPGDLALESSCFKSVNLTEKDPVMEWLFFICLLIPLYVYFGYPALLILVTSIRKRSVHKNPKHIPTVTVIIPAYNEENIIEEKIQNTLALNYPQDLVEIIVVSDGSTDRTEEIVRRYEDRIRLLPLPRSGKVFALNQAVAHAHGDLIAFTDANALIHEDAIMHLANNFADPKIGCVCGNQKYTVRSGGDSASRGEGLYWRYDKFIKKLETRAGNAIAADGSIYAIRRKLYVPIEDPTQVDDHAISVRVIPQGYRLIFEPQAVSFEDPPDSIEQEFRRKIRNTMITARAVFLLRDTWKPWRTGFYAIEVLSHKVLRYLVPFFLLIAFVANIFLLDKSWFFRLCMAGQILFYLCAGLGYLFRESRWGQLKLFWAPLYFCLANGAALLGLLALIKGGRISMWETQRGSSTGR